MKLLADGVTARPTRRLPGASSCLSPGPPSADRHRTRRIVHRQRPVLAAEPRFAPLEGAEAGQIVAVDCIKPLGEAVATTFGEDLGEGPNVPGEGYPFGAADQDGLKPELFGIGGGVEVAQYPAGHGARRRQGDRGVR